MSGHGGATEAEATFLAWLADHGATFPKVEWPSLVPSKGYRGAVATAAIAPGEPIVRIPEALMMAPPHAYACADIGAALSAHEDDLRGDTLLCVFLMSERLKGERSFYAPYLRVLPSAPPSASRWTEQELSELQDPFLARRAKARGAAIGERYRRFVLPVLEEEALRGHPVLRPAAFTEELFAWAWGIVSSRAFGRRLPWAALVPMADCLNHANVATKYAFDAPPPAEGGPEPRKAGAAGSSEFRLFSTAPAGCRAGEEVYNSYGRRANDNLLLEYGFALRDNEWDAISVQASLRQELRLLGAEATEPPKRALLRLAHLPGSRTFRLGPAFEAPVLHHLRICTLLPEEIEAARGGVGGGGGLAPLCRKSEVRTLEALARMVADEAADFRSTLDGDLRLLEGVEGALRGGGGGGGGGVGVEGVAEDAERLERLRAALYYRLRRKEIVACWTTFLRAAASALRGGGGRFGREEVLAGCEGGAAERLRECLLRFCGTEDFGGYAAALAALPEDAPLDGAAEAAPPEVGEGLG